MKSKLIALVVILVGCGGSENATEKSDYAPTLTSVADATNAECPEGGVVIRQGVDADLDGTLGSAEVTSAKKVCNSGGGIGLIKTYSGSFTTPDLDIAVPEMKGKPGVTFALAYWAYASAPGLWTPCVDGWLDDFDYSMMCWVSWEFGTATYAGFPGGSYLYRVDVYGEL